MQRVTILLEDDVYAAALARAGSPRRLSDALNTLCRAGLAGEALATSPVALLLEQVAALTAETARLASATARLAAGPVERV
jgi:hypothetical protein